MSTETDLESTAIADRIVGSWELVEYSTTSDTGKVDHPLGPDARGLIIYSSDGFMSAQIMRPDRTPYRSPNVHSGEMNERSEAAGGYLAYSGPYRVDEDDSAVWHEMAVSLYPNWLGDDQKRYVRFDHDRMTLSSEPLVFRTATLSPALIWRRTGLRAGRAVS
ncbi:lipocalin-like domain-containing protein [Rhodococcus artemisiae]|uniref:Lipocalin-like domain-containing protein n=1 Tax=Rhodococcus artemisiae TaxID=714159 RepID=A0ABU7LGT9_9NOCA|nr:lipocalin-like domain-containing protein [Rhodococcus artemisiae]MEE2060457.1 lipocalin-like domain-containing protein [Rhodococcus artemisiae]